MTKGRPKLAIAAIFPAALVPIAVTAMRTAEVSDFMTGLTVGLLLGASLLLIALALRPRPAERQPTPSLRAHSTSKVQCPERQPLDGSRKPPPSSR